MSECDWLLNVKCNDISVISVMANRCAGRLKKLDIRSGSQGHSHFVGLFNDGYSEQPSHFSSLLRRAWGYGGHILVLNPNGLHGGQTKYKNKSECFIIISLNQNVHYYYYCYARAKLSVEIEFILVPVCHVSSCLNPDEKKACVHPSSTKRHFRPIQCQVRSCMHPHQDTSSILLFTGIF